MKTIIKYSLVALALMIGLNTYAIEGDFLLNVKKANGKEIGFTVNGIQKATVTIYDSSHNVIYNETLVGKDGLVRTYKLEDFPEGFYYLEVETKLKKVTHKIAVGSDALVLSRKSVAEIYKGELKAKNNDVVTIN